MISIFDRSRMTSKSKVKPLLNVTRGRAPGKFAVVVYHGSGKDVVIITFALPQSFFHRVVLDEAHTIKNGSSQQSKGRDKLKVTAFVPAYMLRRLKSGWWTTW